MQLAKNERQPRPEGVSAAAPKVRSWWPVINPELLIGVILDLHQIWPSTFSSRVMPNTTDSVEMQKEEQPIPCLTQQSPT